MKKIISYISIVIMACTVITGCLPEKADTGLEYKGPTVVEFKNFTLGQLSAVLTAKGVSTSAADAQTDTAHAIHVGTPSPTAIVRATDSILVQLVGPQRSTPTVINYTVRSTSTAVEGTNYTFNPAGARSVTIPANSSSAYILINTIPYAAAAPATTSTMLILDLVGASGIAPSFNYKAFYIKLEK